MLLLFVHLEIVQFVLCRCWSVSLAFSCADTNIQFVAIMIQSCIFNLSCFVQIQSGVPGLIPF